MSNQIFVHYAKFYDRRQDSESVVQFQGFADIDKIRELMIEAYLWEADDDYNEISIPIVINDHFGWGMECGLEFPRPQGDGLIDGFDDNNVAVIDKFIEHLKANGVGLYTFIVGNDGGNGTTFCIGRNMEEIVNEMRKTYHNDPELLWSCYGINVDDE